MLPAGSRTKICSVSGPAHTDKRPEIDAQSFEFGLGRGNVLDRKGDVGIDRILAPDCAPKAKGTHRP